MLVTNRGSARLDTVGIALTAPHLILLGRASAVPLRTHNVVSDLTEYAGTGYTGGFGGATRAAVGDLSVAEDDANFRSEITFGAKTFTGVSGPDPIAPVAALIEEITNDGASNIIAFIPIKATAAGIVPSAATEANPAVITTPTHGLTTGDLVYIEGFAGGTWAAELNGKVFKVTVVNGTSFSLDGVNSTAFGTATFASAIIYRPLAMNGADVTITPNAEGAIQSRTNIGAV